ncbi:MAG TPA: Uma2 family endonuclease [Verrucomicrobiota bacterium]|nr:Uma2 family endonuclease [Verrucomicrobiota bacterium]
MSALLEELRRSPALPRIVDNLQRLLAAEAGARRRFREEITEDQKGEFINGEIVMHSPATARHIAVIGRLNRLLGSHVSARGLGQVYGEKALVCLTRNDYEPDLAFFGPQKARLIKPGTREFPAPDLAIEVLSGSTEKRDRGVKFEDDAAHGVQEYLLVAPRPQEIEQYVLRDDAFVLKAKLAVNARYESVVVPGFSIPVVAVFDDEACNRAVLAILSSPT